jgi:hypothetical protein
MLHASVQRFDVTGNLKNFVKFSGRPKLGLEMRILLIDLSWRDVTENLKIFVKFSGRPKLGLEMRTLLIDLCWALAASSAQS